MDGMLVAIYKHVIRVFGGKNQQEKTDRSEHPTRRDASLRDAAKANEHLLLPSNSFLRNEQKRQFEMHRKKFTFGH
jgi:hypothetical protein